MALSCYLLVAITITVFLSVNIVPRIECKDFPLLEFFKNILPADVIIPLQISKLKERYMCIDRVALNVLIVTMIVSLKVHVELINFGIQQIHFHLTNIWKTFNKDLMMSALDVYQHYLQQHNINKLLIP